MQSTQGKLLVAAPSLSDPNFRRAVLMMVEHSPQGAFGVVLNRPSRFLARRVVSDWQEFMAEPEVVFVGGPVVLSSLIGLASVTGDTDSLPSDSWRQISGPIGTVNLSSPPEQLAGLAKVRIFAGHASWAPGQLETEMAADSWFALQPAPSDPFTAFPDELWWQVFARQEDADLRQLRLYPDDLQSN